MRFKLRRAGLIQCICSGWYQFPYHFCFEKVYGNKTIGIVEIKTMADLAMLSKCCSDSELGLDFNDSLITVYDDRLVD